MRKGHSGQLRCRRILALTVTLASSGSYAGDDCQAPIRPQMPDGATASMEAMLAGQRAVQSFQASNMDYMHCLEEAFTAARERAKASADSAERELSLSAYEKSVEAYNAAVSAEEEIAGDFNIELREFKAARR